MTDTFVFFGKIFWDRSAKIEKADLSFIIYLLALIFHQTDNLDFLGNIFLFLN